MGSCHNTSKFGFVACPDSGGSGKFFFRVNENNTIFRGATTSGARTGSSNPPALNHIPAEYQNWPPDSELMRDHP